MIFIIEISEWASQEALGICWYCTPILMYFGKHLSGLFEEHSDKVNIPN